MKPKRHSRIRVRAKAGRIAREHPRGPIIPEDKFVAVQNTSYIQRLIHHHGDLIVEQPRPTKATKPVADKEKPKADPTPAPKQDPEQEKK